MELVQCKELLQYLETDPQKVMALDIETTGLYPPQDEILSLAIIDGSGRTLFYEKFKPEHNTEWPEAQAVNGISPETVSGCRPLREYVDDLNSLLSGASVIVGYNHFGFDLPYLGCFGITVPEQMPVIDVMLDYAELKGEWSKNQQDWKWQKLTDCATHYEYHYNAHDSLEDAKATLFCAQKCAEDELQPKAGYCLENGNILFVQKCDTGCDYTLYDPDNNIVDGGRLDNAEMTVLDARNEIVLEHFGAGDIAAMSRERLEEFLRQVEEAAEQPKTQQKEKMQVLIVRPGQYPEKAVIDGSLKSMQNIVGGSIELVYPWAEHAALVCNDEGLLLNLPLNRFLREIEAPIAGTFFICGLDTENLIGLTDDQMERFEQRFHYPQAIAITDAGILATEYMPEHLPPLMEPLSP